MVSTATAQRRARRLVLRATSVTVNKGPGIVEAEAAFRRLLELVPAQIVGQPMLEAPIMFLHRILGAALEIMAVVEQAEMAERVVEREATTS